MKSIKRIKQLIATLLTGLLLLPHPSVQTALAQSPGSRWETYSSGFGRFSVQMPSRPVVSSKTIETSAGPTIMHSWSVQTTDGEYFVAFNDYRQAPTDIRRFFQKYRDGVIGEGRLLNEKELELAGHPGLGLVLEKEGAYVVLTTYLVRSKLYQVMFSMPKGQTLPPASRQFFASFALQGA